MRRYCAKLAVAVLCCAIIAGNAAFAQQSRQTRVTIAGVHYTLPSYVDNAKIEPRDPLCYDYEYFYILIKDRELFIDGASIYKANPGDRVVVSYPSGVTVNGMPAPQQHREHWEGARPCSPSEGR